MMKKQRKKIVPCDLVEKKKLRFFLLAIKTKTKNYSKILENSQLLHTTLKTILLLSLLVLQSDEKILMHINKKKVSSIAVFMQSAMYYKLMPFWTTTKKVSLFLLKLSFILSTTLHILSQSRQFSLVFCFFHLYYPSTNYAHKNAAFCVKALW